MRLERMTLGLLDPRSDQLSYTSTLREEVVGKGHAPHPTISELMTQNDPLRVIKLAMLTIRSSSVLMTLGPGLEFFLFLPKKRKGSIKMRVPWSS